MLTKNYDQLRQQVAEHVAADRVVQGVYWDAENRRGCFIGCLTHSNDPVIAQQSFGLPIMVQRIAESIFEALPPLEAPAFFEALPNAVACDGKDLGCVGWQFLAAELRALPEMPADVQAIIDPVIAGMDLLANGQPWPAANVVAWDVEDTAEVAVKASADAAAWSADAAVRAAADLVSSAAKAAAEASRASRAAAVARAATWADWAARAARAAAKDARDAAVVRAVADAVRSEMAIADAAGAAARAAACRRQRDLLLRLISEAPVVGVGQ